MGSDTQVPVMVASMSVMVALSLVFMMLRFYCKWFLASAKLRIDDHVLFASWILLGAFFAVTMASIPYGLGIHLYEIPDRAVTVPKLIYLMEIFLFFSITATAVSKSSFIITLLRVVQLTEKWYRRCLWFMLVSMNTGFWVGGIVQFWGCSPGVEGIPPEERCIDFGILVILGTFASAYSAALDMVLSGFPSVIFWNMHALERREKVGIITAMSLAFVAGAFGIWKAVILRSISREQDFSYGTATLVIVVALEVTCTIMAASIPFYRPLAKKVSCLTIACCCCCGQRRRRNDSLTVDTTVGSYNMNGHVRPDLEQGLEVSVQGISSTGSYSYETSGGTAAANNHDRGKTKRKKFKRRNTGFTKFGIGSLELSGWTGFSRAGLETDMDNTSTTGTGTGSGVGRSEGQNSAGLSHNTHNGGIVDDKKTNSNGTVLRQKSDIRDTDTLQEEEEIPEETGETGHIHGAIANDTEIGGRESLA